MVNQMHYLIRWLKYILVSMTLMMLSSCSISVGNLYHSNEDGCKSRIRSIPSPPSFPDIDEDKLDNDAYVIKHLSLSLQQHREYVRVVERIKYECSETSP